MEDLLILLPYCTVLPKNFTVKWQLFHHLGPILITLFLLWSMFVAWKRLIHITPFLYRNGGQSIRFVCSHWSARWQKWSPIYPFLSVHTAPVLWRSLLNIGAFSKTFIFLSSRLIQNIYSVFENLRFCGVFVGTSVNTFKKTGFLPVFIRNGATFKGLRWNAYPSFEM